MALSISPWYCAEPGSELLSDPLAPAQTAFDRAIEELTKQWDKDPKKRQRLQSICGPQRTSLCDVLAVVTTAQQYYERKHAGSKALMCVVAFSKRIGHYGNIMNVLVQHHPEYVSLAWGAFKLLFGAVVEHEHTASIIVTGLCEVADALPRVQLATILYPTNMMKQLVATLYANILKFLVRALGWYEEGKLAHAIHSITRPAALRYDDLLQEIGRVTQSIAALAAASSQAEQRDMHEELRTVRTAMHSAFQSNQVQQESIENKLNLLTDALQELRTAAFLDRPRHPIARIDLRHPLSDISLSQALGIISSKGLVDHISSYQKALVLRDRRQRSRTKRITLRQSPELLSWNAAQRTSLIHLKSTFKDRHHLQDFCMNVVEQLVKSRMSVLWALRGNSPAFSAAEMLKSLIYQALSLDHASHTDIAFSYQLRKFLDATSEADYVKILAEILSHFQFVYIVIETEAVDFLAGEHFSHYTRMLTHLLEDRGCETIMKIIAITYRPDGACNAPSGHAVLKVPKASRRRGQKLPMEPLQLPDQSHPQSPSKIASRQGRPFRMAERALETGAG